MIAAVWIAALALITRMTMRSRAGSVGLPIAFLYAMSFLYCGFLVYAVPGYTHSRSDGNLYLQSYVFTEETVLLGTQASLLGVVGFALGCWFVERSSGRKRRSERPPTRARGSRNVVVALAVTGILGFILTGSNLPIPMLQALTQAGRNIAIVAICLGAVNAVMRGHRYRLWTAGGVAIPVYYLLAFGFVSYGFISFTIMVGFWFCQLASRRISVQRLALVTGVCAYALLSLFVTWMTFREQLRAVLWSDAGIGERISAVWTAAGNSTFLSPWNVASLDDINGRLNQYIFVGKLIEWHDMYPQLQLGGKTIMLAFFSWVPRFMWSEKPEMGGNSFVADNTGMLFSSQATFGAGPVFEFYANFGYAGVAVGFFLLGIVLSNIDKKAALALREGNSITFAAWFSAGIAFVAPLTDLFFMVSSAVMCWIIVRIIGIGLNSNQSRPPRPLVTR